jgi:hypothetical protein
MQDKLIPGKEYHLWKDGEYLGVGTYLQPIDPMFGFFMVPYDVYNVIRYSIKTVDHYQAASELVENENI